MGKKSKSVSELLKNINISKDVRDEVDEEVKKQTLATMLFSLRCDHKLTQKELADKTGWSQSKVSKLESAHDDEISVQDLLIYAKALNLQLEVGFRSNSVKIIDLIKYHAFRIKDYLNTLTQLAGGDEDLEEGAFKFHGEALFNIVNIIQESASTLKIAKKKSIIDKKKNIHISIPFEMKNYERNKDEVLV